MFSLFNETRKSGSSDCHVLISQCKRKTFIKALRKTLFLFHNQKILHLNYHLNYNTKFLKLLRMLNAVSICFVFIFISYKEKILDLLTRNHVYIFETYIISFII